MGMRLATGAVMAAFTVSLAACGGGTEAPDAETAAAPAADVSHEGHTGGRVYFVSPRDGETIKTTHRFEFGSDMYEIAAVPPEGTITADQVRPGVGHFHLGVDTECLPPGTEIPKADPWIHFGTGTNNIEMNLTPGEHTLTVQAGDDLHRTVEGLCETIRVTVVE